MADRHVGGLIDAVVAKMDRKLSVLSNPRVRFYGLGDLRVEGAAPDGQPVELQQRMTVNVSKLGKLFNQFPARISVGGRSTTEAEFNGRYPPPPLPEAARADHVTSRLEHSVSASAHDGLAGWNSSAAVKRAHAAARAAHLAAEKAHARADRAKGDAYEAAALEASDATRAANEASNRARAAGFYISSETEHALRRLANDEIPSRHDVVALGRLGFAEYTPTTAVMRNAKRREVEVLRLENVRLTDAGRQYLAGLKR
jgi:hypothetical protein